MKKNKNIAVFGICICICIFLGIQLNANKSNNYNITDELYTIETSYCNLYYPKKWENDISIECAAGKEEVVEFYAQINREKIHLFDIVFGEVKDHMLGTIDIEGEKYPISILDYDLKIDNYSEKEQNDIKGMNEDLNVVIAKLVEENNLQFY